MDPQTLDLARWQFALTAAGHFLFVSLTLGLAPVLACVQTWAVFSGAEVHGRMVRFWGLLYVVNYAVGIVTGIVMEFQFGMAWSGLGHYAGGLFGASLAMETVVAFFVESTFLGLWIFGWNRFGKWVHLGLLWVVTLTAYVSAYWILVTNGFLNNPVGYRSSSDGAGGGGGIELDSSWAVLTNPSTLLAFFHIFGGALLTAAVFMAGVSAYHLFKRSPAHELFRKSLRIGVYLAVPALFLTAALGGVQLASLAGVQPVKLAVFQGQESEVARLQAESAAQFGAGDYVPSTALTRGGAIVMLLVFALLLHVCLPGAVLAAFSKAVHRFRAWHVVLMALVPLPYVAMTAGWVFREAGRQPWVIQGLLKTEDAVSQLSAGQMRTSLAVFGTLFALLLVLNWWLLLRTAARGPGDPLLGRDEREPDGGGGDGHGGHGHGDGLGHGDGRGAGAAGGTGAGGQLPVWSL
ncbi:cytochrome ubiquinol oxidase subunit I [Streptomyces daqingensis]|uniref:Cytochrome ubiquinol oxidase subunit I n=1 Tax=Streptomyces daqingensis TaxID=1472640 RepID=A0ABQ2M4J4_9ACTN|nr:cytochrome ubiquinol oxidase subunit I [Streptomyces daqingensis]GGO46632.1 cytochrome ubiquinol oxidase subunit I [Streptomyces daqingensis]